MGFLTSLIQNCVYFEEKRYKINAAFDIVLDVQNLYKENLSNVVKMDQALRMFGVQTPERIVVQSKELLLNEIFKECVNTKKRPQSRSGIPVFDFEEDGEYIYASFMLDYKLDLVDVQGKLHWKKFVALFQGLSEQTKIREVMRIRGMDVPKYNGHNQKDIQRVQELKSYYALPVRGGGGQEGLEALFTALEALAVKE